MRWLLCGLEVNGAGDPLIKFYVKVINFSFSEAHREAQAITQ